MVPGLAFDYGDDISVKDATAMLTNDKLENNLDLPSTEFSLRQVRTTERGACLKNTI